MIDKVLAVIIDYHDFEQTQLLATSIATFHRNLTKSSFQLTVVHFFNESKTPGTLSSAEVELGVVALSSQKNLGYAGALNAAILELRSQGKEFDAYWFLNSDLEVDPKCLPHLVHTLNTHPDVGATGPIVYHSNHREKVWGARGVVDPLTGTTSMIPWRGGILPKWSYIPGCSLLVRKSAFDAAGGLPEKYHLYFEETELCVQLQKLGWKLWIEPSAWTYHKVASLKHGVPARHFSYYFVRNNLKFWNDNFGIPIWVQFPRMLYVVIREVLLPLRRARNWSLVKDRIFCIWAGIIDGIRFARKKELTYENVLFGIEHERP